MSDRLYLFFFILTLNLLIVLQIKVFACIEKQAYDTHVFAMANNQLIN